MRPHFPTPSLCDTQRALKFDVGCSEGGSRTHKVKMKPTQTKEIGNTRQSIDHTKSN